MIEHIGLRPCVKLLPCIEALSNEAIKIENAD